jgi:HSP20 family protein
LNASSFLDAAMIFRHNEAMPRSIRFTRIVSMTNQVAAQLQGLHFAAFHPLVEIWQPAVNVYEYKDRLEVCVDLAGVRKQDIDVEVAPHRLIVRGQREAPERGCAHPPCGRILMMEIPDGSFQRILEFPLDVDTSRVEARQENGWLWITLPRVGADSETEKEAAR